MCSIAAIKTSATIATPAKHLRGRNFVVRARTRAPRGEEAGAGAAARPTERGDAHGTRGDDDGESRAAVCAAEDARSSGLTDGWRRVGRFGSPSLPQPRWRHAVSSRGTHSRCNCRRQGGTTNCPDHSAIPIPRAHNSTARQRQPSRSRWHRGAASCGGSPYAHAPAQEEQILDRSDVFRVIRRVLVGREEQPRSTMLAYFRGGKVAAYVRRIIRREQRKPRECYQQHRAARQALPSHTCDHLRTSQRTASARITARTSSRGYVYSRCGRVCHAPATLGDAHARQQCRRVG